VNRDVALPLELVDRRAAPAAAKQRALYERFGFRTWLDELGGGAAAPADDAAPPEIAAPQVDGG
jgi:hypothetical protein